MPKNFKVVRLRELDGPSLNHLVQRNGLKARLLANHSLQSERKLLGSACCAEMRTIRA
ncbi:hypothetical protein X743_33150 [Mesorhizobium sp. LNHC252B00]|nr:hypothetical protein X743_33150 [Mesorhizobium sp. LNHC252B00]